MIDNNEATIDKKDLLIDLIYFQENQVLDLFKGLVFIPNHRITREEAAQIYEGRSNGHCEYDIKNKQKVDEATASWGKHEALRKTYEEDV